MEYKVKKERLYHGGNECLRYRLEYPVFKKYRGINDFLDKTIKNCEEYCRGTLYDRARQSKDKYAYCVVVRITHQDGEAMSAVIGVRLLRDGQPIERFVRAVTWNTKTELMIPPELICRRYGKKGDAHYGKKDVFLKNGALTSVSFEEADFVEKIKK